jgi:hypothetical protein
VYAADVGKTGEQENEGDQEDAAAATAGEDHGEHRAGDPHELEAGLEPRERPSPGGLGAVALEQAAETSEARPYDRAAYTSGTAGTSSVAASIHSSRIFFRRNGATIVPKPLPTALAASTMPNIQAGSCDLFNAKAAKNVKNPTTPRKRPIAVPATRMLRACSSSR